MYFYYVVVSKPVFLKKEKNRHNSESCLSYFIMTVYYYDYLITDLCIS